MSEVTREELVAAGQDLWDEIKPVEDGQPVLFCPENWDDAILCAKVKEAGENLRAGDALFPTTIETLEDIGITVPPGVVEREPKKEKEEKMAAKKASVTKPEVKKVVAKPVKVATTSKPVKAAEAKKASPAKKKTTIITEKKEKIKESKQRVGWREGSLCQTIYQLAKNAKTPITAEEVKKLVTATDVGRKSSDLTGMVKRILNEAVGLGLLVKNDSGSFIGKK